MRAQTPKYLTILEVTQKQAYIFADKHLLENVRRSQCIESVTSPAFFETTEGSGFRAEQLVYAGGGHTILQFAEESEAAAFVRAVTRRAYLEHGIVLFAKSVPYCPEKRPCENMEALIQTLEKKKSLRLSTFRQRELGLEGAQEVCVSYAEPFRQIGRKYHANNTEKLCGKDNFYAVIHIDGNGMGAKSQAVSEAAGDDWQACCASHRAFSTQVDSLFNATLDEVVLLVERCQQRGELEEKLGYAAEDAFHPIRPVICAGDDVTFLVPASIALECAAFFLKKLDALSEGAYSACAGIAMVHQKYPFHRAYDMAEQLCDSAKRYAAELTEEAGAHPDAGRIATMDWHIEFGQGKGSLSAVREDYFTEDSGDGSESAPIATMTLRPFCVSGPTGTTCRTYDFFTTLVGKLTATRYPRSKLKNLREMLKKSEAQISEYLKLNRIQSLAELGAAAEQELQPTGTAAAGLSILCRECAQGRRSQLVRRGLYFDAIELMDKMLPLREEEQA